ncbi:MAG: dihydroorotate dehydrogenase [Caldimicrobium sp.]|nr:dihydroorotate dehydrogenase [Caldimicrobium sp.]MDW8094327.1 dihydroorotate dehydrogenase [Caldimicrobium sp.]
MTWKVGNLELKTPIIIASGTWGLGDTLLQYLTPQELTYAVGALVTKGLSLEPMSGNPPPRLMETPCGLINSIGLENPGIKTFLEDYYPRLRELKIPLIFNLHGNSEEEFIRLAEILREVGEEAIELNISCPNVKKGGISFSQSPEVVFELIRGVRKVFEGFIAVKLSPVGPVMETALACESAGADALTIANTYPALGIISYEPLRIIRGGLSGPAIKPLTLRLITEVSSRIKLPIIASGGVMSGKDVFDYLLMGASAVQIGTANLIDPWSPIKIYEEIKELLRSYGRLLDKGNT